MIKQLSVFLIIVISGCATVPDSVKVALEKEGEAISAVESDYNTSINMYHAELIRQIDASLNVIFSISYLKSATPLWINGLIWMCSWFSV